MVTKTTGTTKKTSTAKKATATAAAAATMKPTADTTTPKADAAKNETVKSETTKKPAAKKTGRAAAKKDIKVSAVLQVFGNEYQEKDMVASVKAYRGTGHKVTDIKTMELYIKPEEGAVYYVINGADSGSVML